MSDIRGIKAHNRARGSVSPHFAFVESWPFIALLWSGLAAYAMLGGAV